MPRPPASRPGLTREKVITTAAELVNAEGADALTINRLARDLGVQPSSLYNHVASLADLWGALAVRNAQAMGDCIINAVLGKSGAAGILALAGAYRAYIKQFPGLYQSSLRASGNLDAPDPALQSAEERVVRVALALVESFGLSGPDAIHAVRGLRSAIHGFATIEVAGGFGLPLDLDESFQRMILTMIQGMERDDSSS